MHKKFTAIHTNRGGEGGIAAGWKRKKTPAFQNFVLRKRIRIFERKEKAKSQEGGIKKNYKQFVAWSICGKNNLDPRAFLRCESQHETVQSMQRVSLRLECQLKWEYCVIIQIYLIFYPILFFRRCSFIAYFQTYDVMWYRSAAIKTFFGINQNLRLPFFCWTRECNVLWK